MCSAGEKGSRMRGTGSDSLQPPPCPESLGRCCSVSGSCGHTSRGTRGRRRFDGSTSSRRFGHKAQSAWLLDTPPAHHSQAWGTGYPGPGPEGDVASLGLELPPWVPRPPGHTTSTTDPMGCGQGAPTPHTPPAQAQALRGEVYSCSLASKPRLQTGNAHPASGWDQAWLGTAG